MRESQKTDFQLAYLFQPKAFRVLQLLSAFFSRLLGRFIYISGHPRNKKLYVSILKIESKSCFFDISDILPLVLPPRVFPGLINKLYLSIHSDIFISGKKSFLGKNYISPIFPFIILLIGHKNKWAVNWMLQCTLKYMPGQQDWKKVFSG